MSPEFQKPAERTRPPPGRDFVEGKTTQSEIGNKSSVDGFGAHRYLNDSYINRVGAAVLGICSDLNDKAIYLAYFVDADGDKFDASKLRHALHNSPGRLPPQYSSPGCSGK